MSKGLLVLAQLFGGGGAGGTVIFMVLIFAIMWFLLIVPQQRQVKQHRKMLDTLKKGDEVLTQGGLIGRISTLAGKTVLLELASGVKVKVQKSSIQQQWTEDEAGKSDAKTEEKK